MSTVQLISTGAATGNTYTLAGSAPIAVPSSASAIQSALTGVYGAGNVLVAPVGTGGNEFAAMFIGALWGTTVAQTAVVDNTTGGTAGANVAVTYIDLPYRFDSLFVHTCDIYAPASSGGSIPAMPNGEMADPVDDITPIATGVPCYYEPTPNYSEPKAPGATKVVNLLTADKWHFLVWVPILDRYKVVMRTTTHPLCGHPWIVQGNSLVNAGVRNRPAYSQWVYAVLDPVKDTTGLTP